MKHSDYVKAMLLASIHELAADPSIYAKNPGRDFSRNRKMGFRDFLLMFLTMEADCIKEELYRYFGRSTAAPSKAAFYKQRKKLRDDAFRWLLLSFNKKCRKLLFKDKYSFFRLAYVFVAFSSFAITICLCTVIKSSIAF